VNRWGVAWPFAVVVAALLCLAVVPIITQQRTRALWNELAAVDSVYAGLISREAYARRILEQPGEFRGATATAGRVDAAIGDAAERIRRRIQATEHASIIIDAVLVVVALLAWIVIVRVGREQRAFTARLDRLLEALRESEQRFRQIADNIHDFIWLADPEFTKHFYVNAAYSEIWGRSTETLYDDPSSLLDGVHPDDRPRVEAALAGMRRGLYDIEFRVVRPSGDVRWVWSRGFPVTNEHGEIYRVAGITEDITEHKRITESRVRLVRGFTHDVKNPLGAADGFLSLLSDDVLGRLDAKQCDAVKRARASIQSALELIGNVLELARAEAGQFEIRRAPVDPIAVARDIATEFQAQARAKALSLDFLEREALPPIESDSARVRQIVANLVSNAVKYTPSGGHIEVTVCTASNDIAPGRGDWITIEVSDDGPGIPTSKQRTLFEEFTRFDRDAAQGAGIGLAISQRLANALGGSISVRSAEGEGSTFALWLPSSPAPRTAEAS
jgi:PAS domain S-box-containing protein